MYLLNAFSVNMLTTFPVDVNFTVVSLETARELAARTESAVGHPDTARVFSSLLETDVQPQRVSVTLESGEKVLLGQYRGPRLPEGATELPEGATIQWFVVTVR
jgi:hypothetical protein